MRQGLSPWIRSAALVLGVLSVALGGATASAADGEGGVQGSVEVVFRDVNREGSFEKYDEDFDGLESGLRLANLSLQWNEVDSNLLDYARLSASGLGGDPYERTSLRLGRKDAYDLSLTHTDQQYLYNLFELVGDEDGATWNTERSNTDVGLTVHTSDNVDLVFGFQQGRRRGDSVFLKDVQRDVFRFETPLDQTVDRFTIGANVRVGTVDIVVRQTLRQYDNRFENSTEGNLGLDQGDQSTLRHYDWIQNEDGDADLTSFKLHADLGNRVDLTASLFGTLVGEESVKSRVQVEALGTTFTGAQYGGFCAANPGTACNSDATCAALTPGDVCVPVPGSSAADIDADHTLVDLDLAIRVADPLTLHVIARSLDRDLDGLLTRDLDGDGAEDDIDGDGTPGTLTRLGYDLDTTTLIADYRPTRRVGLRAGIRRIDRELEREGFGGLRDIEFRSMDDETLIFAITARPVDWVRINGSFEEGDVEQPFNAVAPQETDHARLAVSIRPTDRVKLDLGYTDFEHTNAAPDIRATGTFDSAVEGDTQSISFWHRPIDDLDYVLRYAGQDIMSRVGVTFDTAGFAAVEAGDSIFENDNTQVSGQITYRWTNWRVHAQYASTESDGDNLILGDVTGLVNRLRILQDYEDAEVGVTRTFPSGLFVGLDLRVFDYDDRNDLLDYEGDIVSFRAGLTF